MSLSKKDFTNVPNCWVLTVYIGIGLEYDKKISQLNRHTFLLPVWRPMNLGFIVFSIVLLTRETMMYSTVFCENKCDDDSLDQADF